MKILLSGLAFAIGFLAHIWYQKQITDNLIVTAPIQTVIKWDTLIRVDTVWDTIADCSYLYERIDRLESKYKTTKRELELWERSYQKLKRRDPHSASLYSQILVNGK